MIIGHIGVALGAKRAWPRLPLILLLGSTFAPDLWREVLAAAGLHWRLTNLYSHALPWSLALALLAGGLAWLVRRDRTAGMVVAGLVASHILLDMISGDKPLWSGNTVGLAVQNFQQLELVIEATLLLVGWKLVWRMYGTGRSARWALPVMLIVFQAGYLLGAISQRPYLTRCLAWPMGPCSDTSWLTMKWDTPPFW